MESNSEAVAEKVMPTPVPSIAVFEGKKKKKKKKTRYARGTKGAQRATRGMVKAGSRVARALAAGMRDYFKRSEKSGRKRRDGANRDVTKNLAKAFGKTLRRVNRAPFLFARRLPTKTLNRQLRASVRLFIPFMR